MKLVLRIVFLLFVVVALAWCGSNHSAPTQPTVNMTPTRPPAAGPTPTPPPAAMHSVSVGMGGNQFVDGQSGSEVTTIIARQNVMLELGRGAPPTAPRKFWPPRRKKDIAVRASGRVSHR